MTLRHISDEADFRLAYYILPEPPIPSDLPPQAEVEPEKKVPEKKMNELPAGYVDTPLVRLYNFMGMILVSLDFLISCSCSHRNDVARLSTGDSLVPSTENAFSRLGRTPLCANVPRS